MSNENEKLILELEEFKHHKYSSGANKIDKQPDYQIISVNLEH